MIGKAVASDNSRCRNAVLLSRSVTTGGAGLGAPPSGQRRGMPTTKRGEVTKEEVRPRGFSRAGTRALEVAENLVCGKRVDPRDRQPPAGVLVSVASGERDACCG